MKNMFKMISEAASVKRNIKKIQGQLRQKTVEFSAAGGKVVVTARGDASIAAVKINPSVINPAQAGVLEKLVTTAVDGALEAAKKMSADEMRKLVGELGLPDIPGL